VSEQSEESGVQRSPREAWQEDSWTKGLSSSQFPGMLKLPTRNRRPYFYISVCAGLLIFSVTSPPPIFFLRTGPH